MVSFDINSQRIDPPRRVSLSGGRGSVLLSFLLVVVTLAVYYPVHNYPFIDIDDFAYVTQNPHVLAPLSLSTVKWAFTHTIGLNYSPLTLLAHSLDVQMFGVDSGWHHEMNVFLHAIDAVLLFWVLKRATGFTGRSFLVAALFALHPIQVENVAWIAERKTMLSTLFFFLALGAYHWYAQQPKLRRMAVVALLFGLGVLAKPQIITLPFVLLLWDYWPLQRVAIRHSQPAIRRSPFALRQSSQIGHSGERRIANGEWRTLLWEKIPLFAIAAVDAVLTMIAQHAAGPQRFSVAIRLGNAVLSYARYIGMAFWPPHLALMYLHPGAGLRWSQVAMAALLLILISVFVVANRAHRYLLVGWLWFLGTLVPMIGLVQVDMQALADRYAYVSFIGLFIMICWGVPEWVQGWRPARVVLAASSVAILVVLTAMTYRQVGYWSDPITLWTHTLDVTHHNWAADYHLGKAYWQQKQPALALEHLYRIAAERPREPGIALDIASIEQERGNLRQAILYYEKALAISDHGAGDAQILASMGRAYRQLGDEARARECYQAAAAYHAPVVARSGVNWQGDWWRDLIPQMWARVRAWISGQPRS